MDIEKICEVANEYFEKNGRTEKFIQLENFIISTKNAYFIRNSALKVEGSDINKLTDEIIATKKAEYIFYFAKDINRADVNKLTEAIIETKNEQCIFLFAQFIKDADKNKLEKALKIIANETSSKKKDNRTIDGEMDDIIETIK